jgi:hypothetical protein
MLISFLSIENRINVYCMDHSESKSLVNREKEDGSTSDSAVKRNVIKKEVSKKSPLSLSTSQSSSSTVTAIRTESSSSSAESSSSSSTESACSLVIEESGNERYKKCL